jgi:hypothetical protein
MLIMGIYGNQIIELRKQGKTYKQISKELNCDISTVSYHCKLNKIGGNCDRLTDEQKKNLQIIYNEIGSVKKLSKISGHAVETILKYVKTKKREKKVNNSDAVISWRKRTKLKLVEYKGGKCQLCGYNKSINALHFHHLDPKEKEFTISGKTLSFDKLKNEADKCFLVCANCHSEIHDGLIEIPIFLS